ncbi:MAG: glycosyltransferase family 39 protein [Alphaproteobacteria bacterium]
MFEKLAVIPDSFFAPDGKKLSLLAYLFLVMLCVGFFTPGIVTMPPTDRDEASYVQASKQMIESGNYTDIRLQDEPRYKKPIGIYWLQSAVVRVFNPHHLDEIWAYRIPSFVGATVAVLMTAALGSLLFNPLTGLLAAMMLSGCILMNTEARIATTDAALLASVMVAVYGLARAYLGQISGWRVPLVFWTAFAVGILLKGPLILLPILGALLWLKISDKNIAWFRSLRPVIGLLYALVLVAPWFIAITLQSHGAFLQQSAGQDMLAKIWESQNRGMLPPGAHLMALPILFFPFALFAVFAAPDVWKNRREASVKFCLGWIVPMWLVFECSLTKLPHYVLPAYPAIALLTAKFLLDGFPTVAETNRRFPIVLVVGFWLVIGVGFALFFSMVPAHYDNVWQMPQIVAGGFLILSQGCALLMLPRQKIGSLVILTLGGLVFVSTTFGMTIPGLQHAWMSREIVEAVEPLNPCPNSQIVSFGYHEPSLVFLAGTDTMLTFNAADAAKALKEDSCRVAVIDDRNKQDFLDAFAGAPQQPKESGTIGGLNSGHGAQMTLTIYLLPQVAR